MYNFDWNATVEPIPSVTITELGLSFNRAVINLLNSPDKIIVGYDTDKKTIGVKAYSGEKDIKAYEFIKRKRNGCVRIGCKEFVKIISNQLSVDFKKSKRFNATLDNDVIIVPLEVKPCRSNPKK